MKKVVCIMAVLGIVIGGALFLVNLTTPLEAKPWSGDGGLVPDAGCNDFLRCVSSPVITCFCDPGYCCRF